jgi:hypothetical protein
MQACDVPVCTKLKKGKTDEIDRQNKKNRI